MSASKGGYRGVGLVLMSKCRGDALVFAGKGSRETDDRAGS